MTRLTRRTLLQGLTALGATATAPMALAQGAKLNVVATTGMIADAARAIGGDLVEVKALMGPGIDPHAYRQTRTDILAMTRADLVLWNGLYLEAQMEEFLGDLAGRTAVVELGAKIPELKLLAHSDYKYDGLFDPHVWMDPVGRWGDVLIAVEQAILEAYLAKFGGSGALNALRDNAIAYGNEVNRVGMYAYERLQSVPSASRVLISAHDAFNYFGDAYSFDVVGIQGISTESEAGVNRIRELVDMIVERDVRAVFVESSVSDRSVRALVEGAQARGHELAIGGELFSDAMGEPGTYEGTYIGMIDHNATTIARALGGTAPERGLHGKLSAGS